MNASDDTAPLALSLLVAGTFFIENLDATVITPAIPAIAKSFDSSVSNLGIAVSAYLLASGVFIPASGWAAKRFGARRVFAGAIALFVSASVLCGLSSSLEFFVAARALQGIGGAMMVPVGRLAVLSATPRDKLVKTIATLTWPALIAPVLGPPLGGFLADAASWRWIFFMNVPLGLLAFALTLRLMPPGTAARGSQFDLIGFLTLSGALLCALGSSEALTRQQTDLATAVVLAGGAIALAALGIRHVRHASHPLLDLSVMREATYAVAIRGGSLFRLGVGAVPFLVPLALQKGLGYSATASGTMLMAVFAGNLTIKPVTTTILQRGGFRRVLMINGVLNAVTIAACAAIGRSMPPPIVAAILFVGGATRSVQYTALNTIAFVNVAKNRVTNANTLFSTAIQVTLGMGVALGAAALHLAQALSLGSEPMSAFR